MKSLGNLLYDKIPFWEVIALVYVVKVRIFNLIMYYPN